MHVASLSVAPYAGERTVCRLGRGQGMFTRHTRAGARLKPVLSRQGTDPDVPGQRPDHVSRHRLRPRPGGAQQVVGGGASSFAYDAGRGNTAMRTMFGYYSDTPTPGARASAMNLHAAVR